MNTFKRIIVIIAGVIITSFVISKLFGKEMAPVKHMKTESKSSSSQPVVKNDKLTQADYDGITIGDPLTGVGGADFEDIKEKFGKPMNTTTSDVSGMKDIIASWRAKGDTGANVTVIFYAQNDGNYLAAAKASFGMEGE